MTLSPPLRIAGLTHEIDDRTLLDRVDLEVRAGESLAVTGPSGSGKSSLLSIVLGLVPPKAGKVVVAGENVVGMKGRRLSRHRRKNIGMVFQFGELLAELSPVENVAISALLDGVPREDAYRRSHELLAELGVRTDGALTGQLSGGERQRVAVARALIGEPALLLADEPTGALDTGTRDLVADLLFDLPRTRGCALLVVTHDPAIAGRADRTLRLDSGSLTAAP
ncbi:ABC transporter ATP-binding protein [Streptomyces alfalfae]|uniref:ABC transporter ATP-binding protein n=1 Tax=Streptomyces alfalfae TaxID=1642299 RepID=UPI001EFFFAA9|nr:ATP-binding cassette domain-containing protein [Streptomyces alfalfae]